MKHILKLYKMLKRNGSKGSSSSGAFLEVLIGLAVAGILGFLSYRFASVIQMFGGTTLIVIIIGILVTLGIIGIGFFTLIGRMYTSSDIEILITLPFSSVQIAILRVLSFLQLALGASFLFFMAPAIGYSFVFPIEAREWVGLILVSALLPIFVTSILASVVIILMRVLKLFRSRETLKVIGAVCMFFLLCAYYFLVNNDQEVNIEALLAKYMGVLDTIKSAIPVMGFSLEFITTGSVLNVLFVILSCVLAIVIFVVVAKTMYLQGAMNMLDANKGKMLTDEDVSKYCTRNNSLNSLIKKEYRMVRRNPAYLLHNFIVGALWPILVILLFKNMIPGLKTAMNEGVFKNLFGTVNFTGFAVASTMLSLLMLCVVNIPLIMQTIAYSSLSREGSSFMIMKQLPVPYEVQLEAKRRMALRVAHISVTGYATIIMIATAFLLNFSLLYCIVPIVIVFLFTEFHVNTDMRFGIKYADVNWDDEKTPTNKALPLALLSIAELFLFMIGIASISSMLIGNIITPLIGLVIIIIFGVALFVGNLLLVKGIKTSGVKKIRRLRF